MSPKQKKLISEGSLLVPRQEPVHIEGKLLYCEGDGAWNMIRLKKEVLYEFPELKNKRASLNYKMVIPRTPDKIKDFLEELKKSSSVVPILLFFEKEVKQDEN